MDDQARIFDNYEAFQAETGLIDENEKLEAIDAVAFIGEPDNGRFCTSLLGKLKEFCALNPQYHIATMTSDSDEAETAECERRAAEKGLNWDAMSDDECEEFRQSEEIYATTIDNRIRFVNRMDFYLANGNADPNIFLVEVSR